MGKGDISGCNKMSKTSIYFSNTVATLQILWDLHEISVSLGQVATCPSTLHSMIKNNKN